jgi:hypothetical protein
MIRPTAGAIMKPCPLKPGGDPHAFAEPAEDGLMVRRYVRSCPRRRVAARRRRAGGAAPRIRGARSLASRHAGRLQAGGHRELLGQRDLAPLR